MRDFLSEIKERVLIFDGSKGYMLQKMGLAGGECPELWNVTHPDIVSNIYRAYKDAGADVIQTNTMQGNRIQMELHHLEDRIYELNFEGAKLAKKIMGDDGFVAASVGPVGKLFEPSGDLDFKTAYDIFREQVKALVDGGVDIINFETFTDLAEMRAALLAAKDVASIPVICSFSFEQSGRTLMGTDPFNAAVVMYSLGADIVGTNCSFGPDQQLKIIETMSNAGWVPLCAKPNAGIPVVKDGIVEYPETPDHFARIVREFIPYGVRLVGGCCGTTPEFIKEIVKEVKGKTPPEMKKPEELLISSDIKLIKLTPGTEINVLNFFENGKEEIDAYLSCDEDFLMEKALDYAAEEPDAVLFDTTAMPQEKLDLRKIVNIVQGYLKAPFIFRTQDHVKLGETLRIYRGKAGVAVDGLPDQAREYIQDIAGKYGSTVLKEGIPGR